jgi:hypothetical protein
VPKAELALLLIHIAEIDVGHAIGLGFGINLVPRASKGQDRGKPVLAEFVVRDRERLVDVDSWNEKLALDAGEIGAALVAGFGGMQEPYAMQGPMHTIRLSARRCGAIS